MKKYLLMLFFAGTAALMAAPMTVTVKQTGTGTPTDIATVSGIGGVYIGPYQLSLGGSASVDALCVDPLHDSSVGNMWTANVTNIGSGDLSNTYHPASLDAYTTDAEIFYLFENGAVTSTDERTDLQLLDWSLFDSTIATGNADQVSAGASFLADADLTGFNASNFLILTDTQRVKQEFMVASSAVPEPVSVGLMGFGLIGIAGAGLLRRRKQGGSAQA